MSLSGCGGGSGGALANFPAQQVQAATVYTSDQVLPLAAGQSWMMKDQNGNLTYFQVFARPNYQACQSGEFLDLYQTKNAASAYWGPGWSNASDHFILMRDSGTWRGVAEYVNGDARPQPPQPGTYQHVAIAGQAKAYFLLPPSMQIQAGQTIKIDTSYQSYEALGIDATTCITAQQAVQPITIFQWHTQTFVSTVSTPVYSGPVVGTKFCEGPQCATASETWYFAPNIGLVEIDDNTNGLQLVTKRQPQ